MRLCQTCKKNPCLSFEFHCADCLESNKTAVEIHYSSIKEAELDKLKVDAVERWDQYVNNFSHLSSYTNFDSSVNRKSAEYKVINEYCAKYTTKDSNHGQGLMFIGDFTNKPLAYAMYTLRRVMIKHFVNGHGLISFDYTHISDCISNVFGSPVESLYSTSDLLLIDSVNLETICENKHELRAFTAFIKYRLDMYRPTFIVMANAYNRIPKDLETYLEQSFPTATNRIFINK